MVTQRLMELNALLMPLIKLLLSSPVS